MTIQDEIDADNLIYFGTRANPNPYEGDVPEVEEVEVDELAEMTAFAERQTAEIARLRKGIKMTTFDLKEAITNITFQHLAAQGIAPERRKVSNHPELVETLIKKLQTQTALQDDVIKLLEKQLAKKHEELMILVRRLHFEDTATFATETFGVMKKYRDEAFKP